MATNSNEEDMDRKREQFITWNQYFMGVALLAAKQSSVPNSQGACVVNENHRIVSVGYKKRIPTLDKVQNEECHAEMIALVNELNVSLNNCDIYLTHFPCNECTKLIIQAGIKRVVYISEERLTENESEDMHLSSKMFFEAKVHVHKYCSDKLTLNLEYDKIHEMHEGLRKKKLSASRRKKTHDDQFFMDVALLSAERSKNPNTQVGACIVNGDNLIVATGYNGMPNGCSDDKFPWARNEDLPSRKTKTPYVCHAEMNAIMNKNSASLEGCTIYVLLFPCDHCAKLIIQSRIGKVCYFSDKYLDSKGTKRSKSMLDYARIEYEEFTPKRLDVKINYSDDVTATSH